MDLRVRLALHRMHQGAMLIKGQDGRPDRSLAGPQLVQSKRVERQHPATQSSQALVERDGSALRTLQVNRRKSHETPGVVGIRGMLAEDRKAKLRLNQPEVETHAQRQRSPWPGALYRGVRKTQSSRTYRGLHNQDFKLGLKHSAASKWTGQRTIRVFRASPQ